MATIRVRNHYTVAADQTLSFTNEGAFVLAAKDAARPVQLTNYGVVQVAIDVADQAFVAVDADAGSVGAKVLNKAGARIEITGAGTNADLTGIRFDAADGYVGNKGDIFVQGTKGPAGQGFGVYADANGLEVRNDGSIHGEAGGGGTGVHAGAGASVVNSGTITGLVNRAYGGGYGVEFEHGGSLVNHGAIEGLGRGYSIGVLFDDGVDHFENSGTILAYTSMEEEDAVGVLIQTAATREAITIDNSGTIKSNNMGVSDYAIYENTERSGQFADITVNNSGALIGSVILGNGRDVVVNTGEIDGFVRLGGNDDVFVSRGAGVINGSVDGGDGADTVTGGRRGDVLGGGAGDDVLTGGRGADTLAGGADADQYVFNSIADSKPAAPDLISFLEAQDRIDLSAIDADKRVAGDQAFTLVDHLDGHAGQAALSYDASAKETLLQLDVDGDGAADAAIRLTGDQTGFNNFAL